MSIITLIAGAALALSVVFVLLLIWRSAVGREDEKGFHHETDGKSPEAQVSEDAKVAQPNVTSRESTPIAAKR